MTQITGKAVIRQRTPAEDVGARIKGPFFSVTIDWDAKVDRKNTGGWVVPQRYLKRLTNAINDQKAFILNGNGKGTILTDINGETYVNWQSQVWGKQLNKTLSQLGY